MQKKPLKHAKKVLISYYVNQANFSIIVSYDLYRLIYFVKE